MAQPQQLRSDVAATGATAQAALASATAGLTGAALWAAVADLLPGLIDLYGEAAAVVAADWYDDYRAEVSPPGSYDPFVPDLPDPGAQALVGWARYVATVDETALSLVQGGLQRRVSNGARLTVVQNVAADRGAVGWQRVASGGCAFCQMLAGRGAVYTEATVDFASHDDCKCAAVPAFRGAEVPVKPYAPSLRDSTERDRERVREWLDGHGLTSKTTRPSATSTSPSASVNIDATRTEAQLRATLVGLQQSLLKFDSPATRTRIAQIQQELASR